MALPLVPSRSASKKWWPMCLFVLGLVIFSRHRARPAPAAPAVEARIPASGARKLDLVFTLDCTGSMGAYIDDAKENIEAITARLVGREGQRYDLRFGVVAYRDHKPQDDTWVVAPFPLTRSVRATRTFLASLEARGGGDTPEAVGTALRSTLEDVGWRPDATKVVILIADAPPHGLEPDRGDGFPNGEPNGVDPFAVLGRMAQRASASRGRPPKKTRPAF